MSSADFQGLLVGLVVVSLGALFFYAVAEEKRSQDREVWVIIDSGGEKYEVVGRPIRNWKNDGVEFVYQGRKISTYSPRLVERVERTK